MEAGGVSSTTVEPLVWLVSLLSVGSYTVTTRYVSHLAIACYLLIIYITQGVFGQVQVMYSFEQRYTATVSFGHLLSHHIWYTAFVKYSLCSCQIQTPRVSWPPFLNLVLSSALSWLVLWLIGFPERWAIVFSFRSIPPANMFNQYSISAWCIVFMMGTAIQTGANSDVACIYGK